MSGYACGNGCIIWDCWFVCLLVCVVVCMCNVGMIVDVHAGTHLSSGVPPAVGFHALCWHSLFYFSRLHRWLIVFFCLQMFWHLDYTSLIGIICSTFLGLQFPSSYVPQASWARQLLILRGAVACAFRHSAFCVCELHWAGDISLFSSLVP